MAITKFDKKTCESFAAEIEAALKEIAAKHGLSVARDGGKFTGAEYVSHMKFTVNDVSAREDSERKIWNANCTYLGLFPTDYGAVFTSRINAKDETFSACGFTSSRKFPIEARNVATGQKLRFSETVRDKIVAARQKA